MLAAGMTARSEGLPDLSCFEGLVFSVTCRDPTEVAAVGAWSVSLIEPWLLTVTDEQWRWEFK